MIHHNPYSGKRTGEHYVKLTQTEKDSLERVAHIAADMFESRHTCQVIRDTSGRVSSDVRFLLGIMNDSKEISLLSQVDSNELVKTKEANKKLKKA